MRANRPIGFSGAIERLEWWDNNWKWECVKTWFRNLAHILNLTPESDIAYQELVEKHEPTKNRFAIGDKVILVYGDKIFLYDKPIHSGAKNINILDIIPWVDVFDDTVMQYQVLDKKDTAYIAYGLFPSASDGIVRGYNVYMITLDKQKNTIKHGKIIDAAWSESEPHITLEWEIFNLTTHREKDAHQYYNPTNGMVGQKKDKFNSKIGETEIIWKEQD